MEKQTFLENIATRLGRTGGQPVGDRSVRGVPEFWSNRTASQSNLAERFQSQFTAQGAEVHTCKDMDALLEELNQCLVDVNASHIGAWGKMAHWTVDIRQLIDQWGAIRFDEVPLATFANVQVSVTGCTYAIADTGTIVMTSAKGQGRSAHVLPLIHIVVLRASQIRLRLGDVFKEMAQQSDEMPASVHFVSGPSRSSDIENDQSIGVHGPARVIAFILDDSGANTEP